MKGNLIKNKLLKLLPQICFYCGEPASDREHVIPKSLVGENTIKVWSCRECNIIASNNIFETIDNKRHFIQAKLKKKYIKILTNPEWQDEEIEELSGKIKQEVKKWKAMKKWIETRLAWSETLEMLTVIKCLEDISLNKEDKIDRLSQIKDELKLTIGEL